MPARPHEQAGGRHMQARRNPSPAATKSHAGVRVQRQPVRSSRPAPERYLFGYERGAAARPASQALIKSARREQPLAQCTSCGQIVDERSVSLFAGWIALSWLRGSAECRVRAAATRLERRGGTNIKEFFLKSPFDCQSAAVPGQNVLHMRHGDRTDWQSGAHAAQSRRLMLGRRTANQLKCR
jgi:hypothetical protein